MTLVPRPRSLVPTVGEFTLDVQTVVHGAPELIARAEIVLAILRRGIGLPLAVTPASPGRNVIALAVDPARAPEAYCLDVTPAAIDLRAGDADGLGHGLQTLRQLIHPAVESALPPVADDPGREGRPALPEGCSFIAHGVAPRPAPVPDPISITAPTTWSIPCLTIEDQPRFGWRGVLLDSCRHYQDIGTIERLLDLMALHKLNRLHWHLTEDQAWRLEIKAYPELTDVGAWRQDTDGVRYGGFYTQAQARHVVAYAARRGITVVPEIELPGHAQAAIAARPSLGCTGQSVPVQTCWGVWPNVYCAGREETFDFLETVLAEVLAIFPSEFIHVGGDEVPRDRWRECPRCQARIASEGLADEDELQSWFVGRIERWLAARSRRLIGWDEILAGGLPTGATVQSWRGTEGAVGAARLGHDTIVSPTSHCYLDHDIGTIDLATAFAFDPVPAELSEAEARHVLGGEMNLWTEYVPQTVIDERLFPRLCGLAEALWSPAGGDYADFWRRYRGHRRRLDRLGVRRAHEGRPVRLTARRDGDAWQVTWPVSGTLPGGTQAVRLTVDGTISDQPVDGSRRLAGPGVVTAQVLIDGEPYGAPWSLTLANHQGLGATMTCEPPPDRDRYRLDDPHAVLAGIRPTADHRGGDWLAWEGLDATVTIDLGSERSVAEIQTVTLHAGGQLIYEPERIGVEFSRNGEMWSEQGHAHWRLPPQEFASVLRTATISGPPRAARWIRITLQQRRDPPDWPWAPDGLPWMFLGQILIIGNPRDAS